MTLVEYAYLLAPIDGDEPTDLRRTSTSGDDSSRAPSLSEYDAGLITRVRTGDHGALEAVHAAHWDGLVRYAERMTHSSETARDIVQDVFLDLWMHRADWLVRGSIASYLYAAVRGRALRVLRHDRVTERHASDVMNTSFVSGGAFGHQSPADDVETIHLLAIVDAVLRELPPRCQEAFILYRSHGLELSDVARIMGTSVGTVKVQLKRAVAALRTALAPHLD